MNRRRLLQLIAAAPLAPALQGSPVTSDANADRVRAVLAAARSFGHGGGYDRSWGGSGSPTEIRHGGERILSEAKSGTYCCGFTFNVAMKALADADALRGKSVRDVKAFQKAWYGTTKDTAEKQCALAVQRLGVGDEVELEDALAGDFIQIWRKSKKPSGHSVLLLGWVQAGPASKDRLGLTYLSSQGSTDGIGVAVEYFADSGIEGGRVDRERTYAARLML